MERLLHTLYAVFSNNSYSNIIGGQLSQLQKRMQKRMHGKRKSQTGFPFGFFWRTRLMQEL
jgi:hypothetical protein